MLDIKERTVCSARGSLKCPISDSNWSLHGPALGKTKLDVSRCHLSSSDVADSAAQREQQAVYAAVIVRGIDHQSCP